MEMGLMKLGIMYQGIAWKYFEKQKSGQKQIL